MVNRVPKYPGRVQLVPVAGQTNIFDMTRADEPTEPGTPQNKATFLTDQTEIAIWGNAANRLPDDALQRLKTYTDERVAAAITQTTAITGTYTGDNTATRAITLGFKPRAVFVYASNMSSNEQTPRAMGVALIDSPSRVNAGTTTNTIMITETGFTVYYGSSGSYTNSSEYVFNYIAWRQ